MDLLRNYFLYIFSIALMIGWSVSSVKLKTPVLADATKYTSHTPMFRYESALRMLLK